MRVSITGRHMEMTEALKAYIENGLEKIRTHFDKVIDVDVVLDVEKERHIADINLHANGVRIHSHEVSTDMYASVDAVMAKLDKQIQKYKGRINRHKPRISPEEMSYGHAIISMPSGNGDSEDDNKEEVAHHVVTHEKLSMNPMTVEEAVMQLELLEDPFLVFSNAETLQVNVLYARKDATYGLIEPALQLK